MQFCSKWFLAGALTFSGLAANAQQIQSTVTGLPFGTTPTKVCAGSNCENVGSGAFSGNFSWYVNGSQTIDQYINDLCLTPFNVTYIGQTYNVVSQQNVNSLYGVSTADQLSVIWTLMVAGLANNIGNTYEQQVISSAAQNAVWQITDKDITTLANDPNVQALTNQFVIDSSLYSNNIDYLSFAQTLCSITPNQNAQSILNNGCVNVPEPASLAVLGTAVGAWKAKSIFLRLRPSLIKVAARARSLFKTGAAAAEEASVYLRNVRVPPSVVPILADLPIPK